MTTLPADRTDVREYDYRRLRQQSPPATPAG
jgi:hypothetical protein